MKNIILNVVGVTLAAVLALLQIGLYFYVLDLPATQALVVALSNLVVYSIAVIAGNLIEKFKSNPHDSGKSL